MRAWVIDEGLCLTDIPAPRPVRGEALVRVLAVGICNTDLELLRGYMDFHGVPGHEFVGIVEHCWNEHLLNKRVVGEINCVCHECRYCRLEMPHHCANRTVLGISGRNGAFAEYLTLPEDNLHLVPDSMPDDVAVFTEPVAAAFRILEQVTISSDDRVVVLGDGKLGLLVAQVLASRSKRLTCVGKHPEKLRILGRLGIATALGVEDVEAGADIIVEVTGSAHGLSTALQLVRPEGTIVLKTTVAGDSLCNMSLPVIDEVRILGSRCGPFRPALDALALGTVEVRPLTSAVYDFEDAAAAFQRAADSNALKVVVRMPVVCAAPETP